MADPLFTITPTSGTTIAAGVPVNIKATFTANPPDVDNVSAFIGKSDRIPLARAICSLEPVHQQLRI